MLRRVLIAGVLLASGAPLLVPASAGGYWTSRQVAKTYSLTVGATPVGVGKTTVFPATDVRKGPAFLSSLSESQFRVGATDRSKMPVRLDVAYIDPSGVSRHMTFCNSWPSPVRMRPGSVIQVTPLSGACGTMPSTPTSGSIVVTFYALHAGGSVAHVALSQNRWAVIIGITHYQAPTHPTYGGVGDAYAVRNALLHAGWRSDHIMMLLDSRATAAAIDGAMSWLAWRSSGSTFSFLHYSGHVCISTRGPCGSGHTYLWSYDNRFISETAVRSQLSRVQGYGWFDFSGCESGAFDPGLHGLHKLVSAASQAHETAYEDPNRGESVWTEQVFDNGYNRGVANGGRPYSATIGAMLRYGTRTTPQLTASQPAGAQHPYYAGGQSSWNLATPPAG